MRVLLRAGKDETLTVIEVTEMTYDSMDGELYIHRLDGNYYVIHGLDFAKAHEFISTLYNTGRVSTTGYIAQYVSATEKFDK